MQNLPGGQNLTPHIDTALARSLTREAGCNVHPAQQLAMPQYWLMLVAVGRPHPLINLHQCGVGCGWQGGLGDGVQLVQAPGSWGRASGTSTHRLLA